jgi:hypothetical protein
MGLLAFAVLATVALAIAVSVGCPGGGCPDAPEPSTDTGRFADLLPGTHPTRPVHRAAPARRTPARRRKPHAGAPARAPKARAHAPAPDPEPAAPAPTPDPAAPAPLDVNGAADYVRAFYADLAERRFRAAWPRLAEDLRKRHGSFEAWEKGFATTLRQSASGIVAKAVGPSTAQVSLTLTAVDRDAHDCEVTRRFAILWRLDQAGDEWHAVHAEGKALKSSPTGVAANATDGCR